MCKVFCTELEALDGGIVHPVAVAFQNDGIHIHGKGLCHQAVKVHIAGAQLHLIGGETSNSAATHPVGAVGYGICFAFFGLLGGGGFLLPFLLGYLAVMWRRLLDRHKLVEKVVK